MFEQRVFEGKLGFDAARFALPGATAAQLAIDPAGIVSLGHDHMESAELRELRKRNRLLEQEAEVMRRAVAYLSRDINPK